MEIGVLTPLGWPLATCPPLVRNTGHNSLHAEFSMTYLGHLHHFLGICHTFAQWPVSVTVTVCC